MNKIIPSICFLIIGGLYLSLPDLHNEIDHTSFLIGAVFACLYVFGQYILFNKLFSKYNFYCKYKKIINHLVVYLVILLPVSFSILSDFFDCSSGHRWCHGLEGLGLIIGIVIIAGVILSTFFTIYIYDRFITKTTDKTKKIIDIVGVIVAFLLVVNHLSPYFGKFLAFL